MVQPVIAKTFEALGITVKQTTTSADNWDQLDEIIASKDFDLLLWAQHTLPAGDPQFFINHFFRSDGGGNYAGFASSDIDGMIDALSDAEAGEARIKAASEVHKAILEQVPVSILFTPSWHVGLGSKLANYRPYGSDYYVIHADFALEQPDPSLDCPAGSKAFAQDPGVSSSGEVSYASLFSVTYH